MDLGLYGESFFWERESVLGFGPVLSVVEGLQNIFNDTSEEAKLLTFQL